jgi:hypothetical protein
MIGERVIADRRHKQHEEEPNSSSDAFTDVWPRSA